MRNFPFRILIALVLFYTFFSNDASAKFRKSPPSSWVTINTFDKDIKESKSIEADHYYLLIDDQINTKTEEFYYRRVVKLFNEKGVSSFSSIDVSTDPKYQQVTFHTINIYRNGKKYKRLPNQYIETLRREDELEYNLYDGRITSYANLNDIRPGDIIEYSYTIKGFNPVFKGYFNHYYNLEFSVPTKLLYRAIVSSKNDHLGIKLDKESTIKPKNIDLGNNLQKTEWIRKNVKAKYAEDNSPSWYPSYLHLQLSNVKSWKEVIDWGIKLFEVAENDKKEVKQFVQKIEGATKNEKAQNWINFVKNEVRYYGVETGLNSHKPHAPDKVLKQRFGDCKDKSLLMVTGLKQLGIKAFPMLVSTYEGRDLPNHLPGITEFNHCVVAYKFQDDWFYNDPTSSGQGGDHYTMYFPKYANGLILEENQTDLHPIPIKNFGYFHIYETYTSTGFKKPVEYEVYLKYKDHRADQARSYFDRMSLDKVADEYLDYFARIYPTIKLNKNVKVRDTKEDGDNEFEVWLFFKIDEMWVQSEENKSNWTIETYPLQFAHEIDLTKTAERKEPYHLRFPLFTKSTTTVNYHVDINGSASKNTITGPGFKYVEALNIRKKKRQIIKELSYDITAPYVKPKEYAEFREKTEQILNEIGIVINYTPQAEAADVNFWAVIYSFVLLILGIIGVVFLDKMLNPAHSSPVKEPRNFGGWLILPTIGLFLTPIKMMYQLLTTPAYWQDSIWSFLLDTDEGNTGQALVLLFELTYNMLFFVFIIYLCYNFLYKRKKTPHLMIAMYVTNFVMLSLDYFFVQLVFTENPMSSSDIISAVVAGAVWIPYFLNSVRVKETFIFDRDDNVNFVPPVPIEKEKPIQISETENLTDNKTHDSSQNEIP